MAKYETLTFAKVDMSTATTTAIVAATTGKKIKVVSYTLVGGGATNVTWKSATTALTGAIPLIASTVVAVGGQQDGGHVLETAAGEALNLTNSAAVQVSGHVSYFVEA